MTAEAHATQTHVDRVLAIVQHSAAGWPVAAEPAGPIADSWRRCLQEYRLDPASLPRVDVASAPELRVRAQALSGLLPTALSAIPELSRALRDCPHLLLLADAEGMIVHRLGDLGLPDKGGRAEVSPGAIWAERRQGTNGLGTSLACGRTAAVHFTDHFAAGNAWLSCVSTPLRDPAGHVVGALNVTFLQKSQMLYASIVEYLLESAGRRIEDLFMLAEHSANWIVGLSAQPEAAGMGFEAALAVGESERVVGANSAARLLFAGGGRSPLGRSLQEVFGRSLEQFLAVAPSSRLASVEVDGRRLYVHVRAPVRCLSLPQPRIPAGAQKTEARAPAALQLPSAADVAGGDATLRGHVARLRRFVDRKLPILIAGETGTGKDVLARALHEESARRSKPFVAVNCAALPDALIESELFGYADGAFTGASRRGYSGRILQSSGGTLFLDEIGDMKLQMQTRLLRVLTQAEVSPLGSDRVVPVDLNVISASHRDLEAMVAEGTFRADLLYRLRGATVTLPALRDRADKAGLLASLLAAECHRLDLHPEIAPEALAALLAYRWPGNIRELRHALTAAIVSAGEGCIHLTDLPAFVIPTSDAVGTSGGAGAAGGESDLLLALRRCGWSVARAARALGVSRQSVYREMQRQGIVSPNRADAAGRCS